MANGEATAAARSSATVAGRAGRARSARAIRASASRRTGSGRSSAPLTGAGSGCRARRATGSVPDAPSLAPFVGHEVLARAEHEQRLELVRGEADAEAVQVVDDADLLVGEHVDQHAAGHQLLRPHAAGDLLGGEV